MGDPKEHPILFSAPLVRAILAGQKTVTRRLVRWRVKGFPKGYTEPTDHPGAPFYAPQSEHVVTHTHPDGSLCGMPVLRCPALPGDRLYVRESLWVSDCGKYLARDTLIPNKVLLDVAERATGKWWLAGRYEPTGFEDTDRRFTRPEFPAMVTRWSNRGRRKRSGAWVTAFEQGFCDLDTSVRVRPYGSDPEGKAVLARYTATFRKHLPAIHVPRWASRLMLDVVDVRVERLHAIDEADAIREGLPPKLPEGTTLSRNSSARERFASLWDAINGKRATWGANPWVWRVEFRRTS